MRKWSVLLVLAFAGLGLAGLPQGQAGTKPEGGVKQYLVLYKKGASLQAAHAAVKAAGGTVVRENTAVGLATVRTSNPDFVAEANAQAALVGAARNRRIGHVPTGPIPDKFDLEKNGPTVRSNAAPQRSSTAVDAEPLADKQWDMEMIDATATTSHALQVGDPSVLVAIIDTGLDASHPDIAPNFNAELSRNFTTDIPLVDGPCDEDPDGSCEDPADVDEAGHGTHVGGSVAAALNDFGIAGVAPGVSLVNLRAGQDSGYFFLQPSVDALTFAADNGIDVANMSYFVDPWLYNCRNNPFDSIHAKREQRLIRGGMQRALQYAHEHHVTLIGAAGNEATDLGEDPKEDTISPDFPPGSEYFRIVSNNCLDLPTEGKHVMSISALGPSGNLSFYSNYGTEQITVAAPGGDSLDPTLPAPEHRILSPYPKVALEQEGLIDENGDPLTDRVIKHCVGDTCAYYRWLQGTSMASPHAVGVAALIVSEFGRDDGAGGLVLNPDKVQARLRASATNTPCPVDDDRCVGDSDFNGFYGDGIVNALNAVDGE